MCLDCVQGRLAGVTRPAVDKHDLHLLHQFPGNWDLARASHCNHLWCVEECREHRPVQIADMVAHDDRSNRHVIGGGWPAWVLLPEPCRTIFGNGFVLDLREDAVGPEPGLE